MSRLITVELLLLLWWWWWSLSFVAVTSALLSLSSSGLCGGERDDTERGGIVTLSRFPWSWTILAEITNTAGAPW